MVYKNLLTILGSNRIQIFIVILLTDPIITSSSKDQDREVLSADIISPKPTSAFGVFYLR